MRDLMLDIETFGTGPQAAIVSIGAVFFDADFTGPLDGPEGPSAFGEVFDEGVNVFRTERDMLGNIDASTVVWWLGQSDDARQALLARVGHGEPLGTVLQSFSNWIHAFAMSKSYKPLYDLRLWSNGPTFDETIMRSAFERYGIPFPVHFRGSRCCRTLFDLATSLGFDPRRPGARTTMKHDALEDALYQARGVILMRQHIAARTTPTVPMGPGNALLHNQIEHDVQHDNH